jgi:hypothetical protein
VGASRQAVAPSESRAVMAMTDDLSLCTRSLVTS